MNKKAQKIVFSFALVFGLFASALLFAATGGHEAAGELDLKKEILYPWINFILLLILFIALLKKPARDFFLTRSKTIAQSLAKSAQEHHKAEEQLAAAQERIAAIEQESNALVNSLQQEGELLRQRMIKEGYQAAKRIEESAQLLVAQETRKAKESLKQAAIAQLIEQTERRIREKFSPLDQESRIRESIKKLETLGF